MALKPYNRTIVRCRGGGSSVGRSELLGALRLCGIRALVLVATMTFHAQKDTHNLYARTTYRRTYVTAFVCRSSTTATTSRTARAAWRAPTTTPNPLQGRVWGLQAGRARCRNPRPSCRSRPWSARADLQGPCCPPCRNRRGRQVRVPRGRELPLGRGRRRCPAVARPRPTDSRRGCFC